MNALNTNSTAVQSSVLGVQNTRILNQDQKREKAEVAQVNLTTESNTKKSKDTERNSAQINDQKNQTSVDNRERSQEKAEMRREDKAEMVATKTKSEESRAVVRFETMVANQAQADKVNDNQQSNQQAAMKVVDEQQKEFAASYAYGALSEAASVKNVQIMDSMKTEFEANKAAASISGEVKTEKFLPPVPITEIKAPIMPSDHIYAITMAAEKAMEKLVNSDANDIGSQLESAPEGTNNAYNMGAPELAYGIAS